MASAADGTWTAHATNAQMPVADGVEGPVLDVRGTPPVERHPRIFGAYERLAPGTSFVLLNDHDPKPLFYQFQAEQTGRFTWEYLEQGPVNWRVRIGRPALAPSGCEPRPGA